MILKLDVCAIMHRNCCSFVCMSFNKLKVHIWAFSGFVDESGSSEVMNMILSTQPQKYHPMFIFLCCIVNKTMCYARADCTVSYCKLDKLSVKLLIL